MTSCFIPSLTLLVCTILCEILPSKMGKSRFRFIGMDKVRVILIGEHTPKFFFKFLSRHNPTREFVTDEFATLCASREFLRDHAWPHGTVLVDQSRIHAGDAPVTDDLVGRNPEAIDPEPSITQLLPLVLLRHIFSVGQTEVTSISAFRDDCCFHCFCPLVRTLQPSDTESSTVARSSLDRYVSHRFPMFPNGICTCNELAPTNPGTPLGFQLCRQALPRQSRKYGARQCSLPDR